MTPSSHIVLGRRLRALRRENGLSLAEAAEATGISTSFLSHVETGKGDISFSRLTRLVELYGISMVDLVPPKKPKTQVVRANDRKLFPSHVDNADMFLLADVGGSAFLPVLCSYAPRASSGFGTPGTSEFIHVWQGTLELAFEDGGLIQLSPGDSAYLQDGRAARAYRNKGRGVLTFISVTDTSKSRSS
jgi:transcriptional regulator with XRE-family HTH domain